MEKNGATTSWQNCTCEYYRENNSKCPSCRGTGQGKSGFHCGHCLGTGYEYPLLRKPNPNCLKHQGE